VSLSARTVLTGFVATELVVAVALLLVPTLLFVTSLPRWSELRHAAIAGAREAAIREAEAWPSDEAEEARGVALVEVANYGADPSRTVVDVAAAGGRGGESSARVTVTLPALSVFGFLGVGEWHWTAEARRRIDDYRSR
jgi:hypothetical protein